MLIWMQSSTPIHLPDTLKRRRFLPYFSHRENSNENNVKFGTKQINISFLYLHVNATVCIIHC